MMESLLIVRSAKFHVQLVKTLQFIVHPVNQRDILKDFVAKLGVQQIRLQTNSGRFPTIFWVSKPTYYIFEPIVLEFKIKKKTCSDMNATQVDNSQFSLSLVEVHRNDSNSRSSRVNYSEITSQHSFIVTIERYTLTPMVAYTFEQTTSDIIVNFSTKRNITIEVSSGDSESQKRYLNIHLMQRFRYLIQLELGFIHSDQFFSLIRAPLREITISAFAGKISMLMTLCDFIEVSQMIFLSTQLLTEPIVNLQI
ncbi:unnamed protein product (macronuclear) [Paramecium tetraurelia]|uniref:Uncharacterized protein n=1 Tax=Paramecium tetraurelia TaxID=5888 RepID=A0BZM1_PARTE|nr:uncharacterized protein GSPATT00005840001 [Paramecium tetraurelia]CAK63988.1 unnamed protein product [Paramecium tetraurelia]|eukprot:XP_001431386.1 hypothetical protein (macronuclear) [Paramecium tetraurelia strain d4-2]